MEILIGQLAAWAISHIGGEAVGGILSKFDVLGFGRTAVKHALERRKRRRFERARDDLNDWLQENTPEETESG